jgi:predicted RNA-binding protein YlxR (DUF448 family)
MRRVNERSSVLSKKKYPRSSLLRFVRIDGKIVEDPTNRLGGRGAYLLKEEVGVALESRAFEKTFKVALSEQEREEIKNRHGK